MIIEYWAKMAREERIITIRENGELHALIAFSMCDDYAPYESKGLWEYLPHDPDGRICFVEKLVAKVWTRDLRKKLESVLVARYPQIDLAVWYRASKGNDRKVIYRRNHETCL